MNSLISTDLISDAAKRRLGYVAVVTAAGIALFYAFQADPIPVDTAKIDRGPIQVTVDEEGVASVRDIFVVSAPVSGRVYRLDLKVGDRVVQDKTRVATTGPADPSFLDDRTRPAAQAMFEAAEAALALAKVRVTSATAELDYADTDLKRATALLQRSTVSQKTLHQAELAFATRKAALEMAQAEVRIREHELERARANTVEPGGMALAQISACCYQVMSPTSGHVLKVHSESERVVAQGTPILEIGNPRDLEIVVDLLSSEAVQIEKGATAVVEQWGGGRTIKAQVRRIEPTGFKKISALGIEEQRVKVRLDIKSPKHEWSALGHDYRVYVKIEVWGTDNAMRLPVSALFRHRKEWAVFVVNDGRAVLKTVKIGRRNPQISEVTEGVMTDDKVILHPSDRITNQVRVVERKDLQ